LSLFVFRIRADHAHHAFAVDDLAVVAHLFNGSPYFHNPSTFSTGISGLDSNRERKPDRHAATQTLPPPDPLSDRFKIASLGKLRILTQH
jgi:hypothetical protein